MPHMASPALRDSASVLGEQMRAQNLSPPVERRAHWGLAVTPAGTTTVTCKTLRWPAEQRTPNRGTFVRA